jgi:glycine cleavage system H lipoate-binding protein
MFPWTDGFRWTLNHIIFLSLFFAVVTTIVATVISAARRTAQDLHEHCGADICWKSDFAELPDSERRCRHELAGRVISRMCDNAFDCRHCSKYSQFAVLPATHTLGDAGIPYSEDRFYHRGHTWVEPQDDGTLKIGLDELADHMIGNPDFIDMPEVGAELELNGTAWRMKKNGKEILVRAPIEGKVVAIGSPTDGWYIKVSPKLDPHDPLTFRHLLRGPEVHGWLNRELERLQLQLHSPNTPPSLADGGTLIHGLMDTVPEADWDTVLAGTFLEG